MYRHVYNWAIVLGLSPIVAFIMIYSRSCTQESLVLRIYFILYFSIIIFVISDLEKSLIGGPQ